MRIKERSNVRSLFLLGLLLSAMLLGCSSEPELDPDPDAREQRRISEKESFERELSGE